MGVDAWALVVSVLVAIGSLIGWWFNRRDAAEATREAKEARAGSDSLEVSLQRIADNFEQDRDLRERELAARLEHMRGRPVMGPLSPAMFIRPPTTRPDFVIEYVSGQSYRLRNVGAAEATNVTLKTEDFPEGLTRQLPAGANLAPGASAGPFLIFSTMQVGLPGELVLTCDQLDNPVRVQLPNRPR